MCRLHEQFLLRLIHQEQRFPGSPHTRQRGPQPCVQPPAFPPIIPPLSQTITEQKGGSQNRKASRQQTGHRRDHRLTVVRTHGFLPPEH